MFCVKLRVETAYVTCIGCLAYSVSCWDPDHPHCICASFHPGFLLKLSLTGSSLTADRIFYPWIHSSQTDSPYPGQFFKTSLKTLLALTCPCAMLRDTQFTPLSRPHATDLWPKYLSIFRILQTEKWMKNNDCTFYLVVIWGANKLQSELYKLWRWWLTRGEGPSPEQCLRVLVLTSAVG